MKRIAPIFLWAFIAILVTASSASADDKMTLTVTSSGGNPDDNYVTLTWGHPDFNNRNDIDRLRATINRPAATGSASLPHASEFEIQTQGGHATNYSITITLENHPGSLTIQYDGLSKNLDFNNNIQNTWTENSAQFNEFGEGNTRFYIDDGVHTGLQGKVNVPRTGGDANVQPTSTYTFRPEVNSSSKSVV